MKKFIYIGIVFLIIILFYSVNTFKDVYSYQVPAVLEFCGQNYNIDDYPFLREKVEKHFYQSLDNKYQMILNHKRADKYFPILEKYISGANLCDDLKYVAVVESALRDDAYSSAGAAGVWQFIPDTARRYGLRVDEQIDERMDIDKSTKAAVSYLQFLLNKFNGSYPLALAGYNMGESGLQYVIELQEEADYFKLNLNSETAQYFIKALVMKEIFENNDKYNIDISNGFKWPDYNIVQVTGPVENLIEWSKNNGYDYKSLRELNQWIMGRELPEGEWELKVIKSN